MRIVSAHEIGELAQRGLIIREHFRPQNCDGLFYLLTLGRNVQSISKGKARYETIDGLLELGPFESMNVEINERLCFKDAEGAPVYWGLILAGARLLASGVSHPATAVDPGFDGTTTLTLQNLRNFPSQSFRPGQDRIAKLLVVELEPSEVPDGWEPTPAYLDSGRDAPPTTWGDVHLFPRWLPQTAAHQSQLEELYELGPPFDVVAAHIAEQRSLLSIGEGEGLSLPGQVAALTTNAASLRASLDDAQVQASRMSSDIAEIQQDVDSLKAFRSQEIERRGAALDQQRLSWIETRRNRVIVIVTIVTALAGAITGAIVTKAIDDGPSSQTVQTVTTTVAP